MQVISVIECQSDSMDSDDLQQAQKMILGKEGLSLNNIVTILEPPMFTPITSLNFIKSLNSEYGKEIKYIGSQDQSMLRAYYLMLLYVEIEQKNNYPHLRTLIREKLMSLLKNNDRHLYAQRYTDNMHHMNKSVFETYFQNIYQWEKIEQYIVNNKSFDEQCMNMMMNILSKQKSEQISEKYKFLSKYFNIDCCMLVNQDEVEQIYDCFVLGKTQRLYIIIQNTHIFVVLLGLEKKAPKKIIQHNESEKSQLPLVVEIVNILLSKSDESTPKFIDEEQSRFRKRSHKNSFGGDIDIISYKDLSNSVNRDKDKEKEKEKKKPQKVFSQRFQTQQMMDLEKQTPEGQNVKKNNVVTAGGPMKGSHLQPILHHSHHQIDESNLQSRRERKKKLSSSAIQDNTQTEKVQLFNAKISFSKHDRNRFVKTEEVVEVPDKAPSQTSKPLYRQLLAKQIIEVEEEEIRSSIPTESQKGADQEVMSPKITIQASQDEGSEMTSEAIIQLLEPTIRLKLKNRKYSYFTQQTISSPAIKPKNAFNNNLNAKQEQFHRIRRGQSKVLTPNNAGVSKRRFEENPLSFSRLEGINNTSNKSPSIQCNSHKSNSVTKRTNKLVSDLFRYQYIPLNPEPLGWIRKEVVYFYNEKAPQSRVFTSSTNHPQYAYEGVNGFRNTNGGFGSIHNNMNFNLPLNRNDFSILMQDTNTDRLDGKQYSVNQQNHVKINRNKIDKNQQHWRKNSVYTTIKGINQKNHYFNNKIDKQHTSKESSIRQNHKNYQNIETNNRIQNSHKTLNPQYQKKYITELNQINQEERKTNVKQTSYTSNFIPYTPTYNATCNPPIYYPNNYPINHNFYKNTSAQNKPSTSQSNLQNGFVPLSQKKKSIYIPNSTLPHTPLQLSLSTEHLHNYSPRYTPVAVPTSPYNNKSQYNNNISRQHRTSIKGVLFSDMKIQEAQKKQKLIYRPISNNRQHYNQSTPLIRE